MKTLFRICRTLALLIFLAGCAPANSLATVTPTPTRLEPTQTPEFEGIADCRWSGTAFVWIDQNGDGEYQEGEQPVPDVSVMIDDALNGYTDVGEKAKTSLEGEADLSVWLPGCPNVAFEFYIEVPDGYVLTTAPRIKEGGADDRPSFGVTYLPGVSTATPLPAAPICKTLPFLADEKIADMAIDEDGTLWVSTQSKRIYRQDAGQTSWVRTDLDRFSKTKYGISLESGNGYVWATTSEGVSIFNGENWLTYPDADSVFSNVNDAAIEKDGSIWFATDTGISYYSATTHSWEPIPPIPGSYYYSLSTVDIASDGSVWSLTNYSTIVRLVWPERTGIPEWEIYTLQSINNDFLHTLFVYIFDFAADASGNVWFSGYGGFARFNISENTWFPQNTNMDLTYVEKEFWHVAPDKNGSAWMADQSTLYHYFPAGTKNDKDVMLIYHTGKTIPNMNSLISIKVGPNGKVWLGMERQIYACEFFD